ncbi:RNA 2',3'-cyclic phosphodiesterase [Paenibacillus sp. PK4536]|uniref:RNA 2',3'-cyclic phosphodiesterase n=1 Tax=Paenibacillus sp. PK4536 TaxID=3024576 RepID=UPI0023595186|nr:RNA 2',3'-cyclic phosphodiesterase [Paenibacillus sp. PK4536]WIM41368.1 RNA 2',3'-cyclic phosphodiesterase [Paenibacillus sp. PK4536]
MGTQLGQERIFVALRVGQEASESLSHWSASIRETYHFRKWTHPQDLHITIQFLGDVWEEEIETIKHALYQVAKQNHSFALQLGSLDTFGLIEAPKVWWVQPEGDLQSLDHLQSEIGHTCTALGYSPEDRPYRPHITIARKYKGEIPFPELEHSFELPSLSWQVTEIVLCKIRVGSHPTYENLATFPLLTK